MAKGKRSRNLWDEDGLESNLNVAENFEIVESVEIEELQGWKDVPISNDFMFQHIMQKKSLCKRFLELLLHKEIADIEYPQLEKTVKPLNLLIGIYGFILLRTFAWKTELWLLMTEPRRSF